MSLGVTVRLPTNHRSQTPQKLEMGTQPFSTKLWDALQLCRNIWDICIYVHLCPRMCVGAYLCMRLHVCLCACIHAKATYQSSFLDPVELGARYNLFGLRKKMHCNCVGYLRYMYICAHVPTHVRMCLFMHALTCLFVCVHVC